MTSGLVIEYLERKTKYSCLNFNGLIDILVDKIILVNWHIFPAPYNKAYAVTFPSGIYLNDKFNDASDVEQYHVLLHEIGHYLRLNKYNFDVIYGNLDSFKDSEDFANHVLYEEKFADRFAEIMFYKLNGISDYCSLRIPIKTEGQIKAFKLGCQTHYDEMNKAGLSYFEYIKQNMNLIK